MLMKTKFLKCLGLICFSVFSTVALAGVTPTPPAPGVSFSGPVPEGFVLPVPIQVAWFSDNVVALIQFNVNYDSANLTPSLGNCGGAVIAPGGSVVTVACSNPSAGVIVIAADDSGLNPIQDMTLGTIDFDVSAAAVGTYPLTVSDEVYGDSSAQPVTPGVPAEGQIQIVGAAYTSNPAPGPIDLGSAPQNAAIPPVEATSVQPVPHWLDRAVSLLTPLYSA